MSVLNVPKALYKARQAQNKMKQVQVVGQSGMVSVLVNGLNEVVEIEIDEGMFSQIFEGVDIQAEGGLQPVMKKIKEDTKDALKQAKKNLEKELVKTTNLDDLKSLLS